MARKPKEVTTPQSEAVLDVAALDAARNEQAQRLQVVMKEFGDDLPYDQERLIHETQFYMQQSAEAMLQAGRRLVVLKEASLHGEFMGIVEGRLGINVRAAQRMMQAAIKFSGPRLGNASTSTRLISAAGNKSKLFELMALEDSDLQELEEGGTVANLSLDAVERASTSELRQMVRELQENYKAQGEVLSDKSAKVDKLQADLKKVKRRVAETPDDQVIVELAQEVNRYAFSATAAIRGDLNKGIADFMLHTEVEGKDCRAIAHGWLLELERAINEIRTDHNIPHSMDAVVLPEFARMANEG